MQLYIGNNEEGPVLLDSKVLTRHGICLGSTGSGKTVGAKVICEEFALAGIPVIAIDPQGDVASLAIPAQEKDLEGTTAPDGGIDIYKEEVEVVIWTPGSRIGVPISLNPLDVASLREITDDEIREDAIGQVANSLTTVLDYDLRNETGRGVAGAMNVALSYIIKNKVDIFNFQDLGAFLKEPPADVGRYIEVLLGNKVDDVHRRLVRLSVGPNRRIFNEGYPINIPMLLGLDETGTDKTRISVICTNILSSADQKQIVVSQIAQSLYNWMVSNIDSCEDEGETPIRALLYIDEVHDYLPPSNKKKPLSKDPLERLLREARKFGVCILLASQNPGDLDYKCLGQVNTWFIGKIAEQQSLEKLSKAIRSKASEEVLKAIPSLEHEFMIISPAFDKVVKHKFRWLLTEHGAPLSKNQIGEIVTDSQRDLQFEEMAPIEEAKDGVICDA